MGKRDGSDIVKLGGPADVRAIFDRAERRKRVGSVKRRKRVGSVIGNMGKQKSRLT